MHIDFKAILSMFLSEPSYVHIYKHVLLEASYKNHYSFRVKNMSEKSICFDFPQLIEQLNSMYRSNGLNELSAE
jgi:hypothetical protein